MTYWQHLRQWQARRVGVTVTEPGATVYAWAAQRSANTHAINVREIGGFNLCFYSGPKLLEIKSELFVCCLSDQRFGAR